ncbi:sugar transferase [Streptococcus uberis]|uniref:sugar transferase n=1 Tax=Streptococcus uberis TaxID=1349 RepID=UPI0012B63990|nr:sugar transferase [Streptococcus uberis]
MRVYITNLNGQSGQSTAQIAQNMVMDIGASLGYRELGIYAYPIQADNDIEMSKRLDGIIGGLRHGDVVIFQTPTWNTTAFDEKVMNKLKLYNIKIAIFIHDVVPLMFAGNYYLMEQTISYFNKADLIIAPSQEMIDTLRQHGLSVEKTLIQGMWDHPTTIPQLPAHFDLKIHFPGNPGRFSFTKTWNYDIPLFLYTGQEAELPQGVHKVPYMPDEQLLLEMSQGGFGLVWMDDHDKGYQKLYCPYKLGTFIAAGIPVIVQKGIANEELITKNKLGFVVENLDEAMNKLKSLTRDDYQVMVSNVRSFSQLVRKGYFTRKILTDAVFTMLQD